MSFKTLDEATGEEIDVFTAAEVAERETAARTAAEGEFGKTKAEIEKERDDARAALAERTNEFGRFRTLSEEQIKKLDEKDRIIYENSLALAKANEDRVAAETKSKEDAVAAIIATKAAGNEKLAEKMKEMWPLLGVDANTPEQLEVKANMVLGALQTTVPDLVATASGFSGGSYAPPAQARKEGDDFADTDAGKGLAKDLGLTLEAPKNT